MSEVSAEQVRDLRAKTGAGMMDCKKALSESGGNFDKAIELLRKKGLKNVDKRADKIAAEGIIYSYIHGGGRIGVMLEMNSETDFVARGDDFQALAKDIAMHIAWSKPTYVSREQISNDVIEKEKEIYMSQLKPEDQAKADRIIPGKIEKFFQEVCLLDQLDVKDSSGKKKIKDQIQELSAKVGEKIEVRRFSRYEVGEGIEKPVTDYAAEVKAAMAV